MLQLQTVSPQHTGLDSEEAPALQPSASDGALEAPSVVNDETDSSSEREECLLKSGLFENVETDNLDKTDIAEIVVSKDMEADSIGCTKDITEESSCEPAEGSVDNRASSPASRQESIVYDNMRTVADEFSLVMGNSDLVDDSLEPSPLRQVLSEERIVDAPPQILSSSVENPSVLEAMNSIPSQEPDLSISRGKTDRATSPVISLRAAPVLGNAFPQKHHTHTNYLAMFS